MWRMHWERSTVMCSSLCRYFYLSPAISERLFESVSLDCFAQPPNLSHTCHAISSSSHIRSVTHTSFAYSVYIFKNTLHYPPYPPTSIGRMCTFTGFAQCRQYVVSRYVIQMFLESCHELAHRRLRNVNENLTTPDCLIGTEISLFWLANGIILLSFNLRCIFHGLRNRHRDVI